MQALTFLAILSSLLVVWKVYVCAFGFLYQGDILTVFFACAGVSLKYMGMHFTTYFYTKPGQKGFVLTFCLAP